MRLKQFQCFISVLFHLGSMGSDPVDCAVQAAVLLLVVSRFY